MEKKGDIWISAVLYFGLGIIVITIILTAGLPVINKLRDKNIAIQTKNSFQILDTNIREVLKGGPGTQRVITMELKKGDFKADGTNESLVWQYNSKAYLTEPSDNCDLFSKDSTTKKRDVGTWVTEGNIEICTENLPTKGSYNVIMLLDYSNLGDLIAESQPPITGLGNIVIRNNGIQSLSSSECLTNTGQVSSSQSDCKIKLGISQV